MNMAFTPIPKCGNCFDVGWVCENHPYCPWDRTKPRGCECGAGIPCPVCNLADADNPARPSTGFSGREAMDTMTIAFIGGVIAVTLAGLLWLVVAL